MAGIEVWKDIPDEDYQASSLGSIRRKGADKRLTPRVHSNGYLRVSLGAGRDRYIHRLVCLTFYGPPPSGNHVDHINHDRADNRAQNLRWVTPQENRARRLVRKGASHPNAKLTDDVVRSIRAIGHLESNPAIAARFGVARETVRDVKSGKAWGHVS